MASKVSLGKTNGSQHLDQIIVRAFTKAQILGAKILQFQRLL